MLGLDTEIWPRNSVSNASHGLQTATNGTNDPGIGAMVFLHVFERPILVLHSEKVIHDLLDTKSVKSSGRPRTAMLNDL